MIAAVIAFIMALVFGGAALEIISKNGAHDPEMQSIATAGTASKTNLTVYFDKDT